MFLVGRMNPPTPGHIRGLCIPFLRVVREKCLEILGPEGDDSIGLDDLVKRASVAPRFFLTNSTNKKRISYLSGAKAALYDNVREIVKDKTTNAQMQEGIFYVKDKQLENPLDPEQKKLYVVEMLGNELALPENRDIMVPKATLNMWIVCQTTGVESWCAAYGPASAIKCALMLSRPKKYDKVFFFMGVDEDPSEMARRSKFCQDSEAENDEGAKVKCIKLERINTIDQEAVADISEEIADGSMSASKIRLLCAAADVATIHGLYHGLLDPGNANAMINDVRVGLRLPRIEDIDASPPPLPPRRSGRVAEVMPGDGSIDKTVRARVSGWTGVQSTPGRNAVGIVGIQRVRDAEQSARLATIQEGNEDEDDKAGGRGTRKRRAKRKPKTSRRKSQRKVRSKVRGKVRGKSRRTVHRKSKKKLHKRKNITRRKPRH